MYLGRYRENVFVAPLRALELLLLVTLVGVFAAPSVRAQDSLHGGSYVTPFPDRDVYRLLVVGDSLSEGMLAVFRDSLNVEARVSVVRQRLSIPGLLSKNFQRKVNDLKRTLDTSQINVVVVMVGSHDRRAVRDANGRWHKPRTAGWREVLSQRVDQLMRVFVEKKVSVYWVGLPSMRNGKAHETARTINEVVRERAYLRGLKFVDVFTSFADEFGNYSPYGPDLTGKIRLLRERDGMHFTFQGNRKLAHFVERELKRDLKQAKSERSVPLAGAPKEQARINPQSEEAKTPAQPGWRAAISSNSKTEAAANQQAAQPGGFFTGNSGGEQSADDGKVTLRSYDTTGQEEAVTLEIVRPAIPASVVALVTRKQSPERLSNLGDTVVDQIAGGLSIMSSVTPAHSASGVAGRERRLSPAQTPFFRILVKGERTVSRPGRSDDFAWPKPEPPPVPKPVIYSPREQAGDEIDAESGMPLPPISPFRYQRSRI